ncbi:MAG: DUF3566 domain-containing protein [Propionibacteriaceae bacterium]|nr:DUF3566 domain-containing protein [Propionibacteriaceae bacterium]
MSEKDPQWPGPDGKPGVSFAPKGSRKQRGQGGKAQQQKQAAQKGDVAATTNLKPTKAPATAGQPAGKQGPKEQGQQGAVKPQGSQPKQAQQVQPKQAAQPGASASKGAAQGAPTPSAAPQAGKAEAPAGNPSAASMWVSSPSNPAPLAPMPAPDGSGSSVQKPVKEGKDGSSTETTKGGGRKTRRARLRLSRIDPWSVMKTAFLFSIAFGIILVVVAAVLWQVIEGSGALDSVNSTMNQLIGDANTKFAIQDYVNSGRVIGLVMLLAAVDVVILTAVATLFAFLYNLAATVLGGLEITLAED